jgi:hypothetical protein
MIKTLFFINRMPQMPQAEKCHKLGAGYRRHVWPFAAHGTGRMPQTAQIKNATNGRQPFVAFFGFMALD